MMSKIDNSTKKLLGGSAVYFVGNALTQLISLLLMRFVTGNVTPEEYGFFNLVTTVSNLVIPIVTLQISDAVFKFVLKSETEDEKRSYISVCLVVSVISVCIIFASVFALSCFLSIPHTLLVALYVSSYALIGVYQKITRCLNKNKVFVTGNLLKTVIFLSLEIALISALDMGIEALLWAHIISLAFALIYTEIRIRALKYFSFTALNRRVFAQMMRFSIPLIPNAIFWWLTSSVNSVIVSARLGMDVNGIYAVSAKFTGVLVMVTSVLNMSWQDTAIADYGNKDFGAFLTKTFNMYVKLIFSAIAVLLPFIALILPYMIDPTYYDAIPYTPFLMMASGTSAMSGFVAQIFTGKGQTKTLLTTSIFGMIANVTVVFLFVGNLGLWAAVLGSLAADVVLFTSRTVLARKEFAKGIDYKSFLIVFVMLVVGSVIYLLGTPIYNLIWLGISVAVAVILNWRFVCDLFTVLFGGLMKKKRGKRDAE